MIETLTDPEYKKISSYIYDKLGIDVDEKKKETVTTKIFKIARRHQISNAKEYLEYLFNSTDPNVIQEFFNEITTNTTEFFREISHFDYIKNNINSIVNDISRIKREREVRLWSAPCSSGEEPITLTMVLKECLPPGINFKILATDISEKILTKAVKGIYTENECRGVPKQMLLKYFDKQPDGFYKVSSDVTKHISYRLFNLMDDFNFKNGFDIIFCRNVMIYFDNSVQERLINKFYDQLVPNGLFFIGHSESLLNKSHKYKFVGTAIYKK